MILVSIPDSIYFGIMEEVWNVNRFALNKENENTTQLTLAEKHLPSVVRKTDNQYPKN